MSIVPQRSEEQAVLPPPQARALDGAAVPAAQAVNDAHPLEARVANWRAAEEAFKMQLLLRSQGAAEPIRRQMELRTVESTGFVPSAVGGPSNVHLDILRNQDASLDWEDVYRDEPPALDFHAELRQRMGL